jgi:hypothetical protein
MACAPKRFDCLPFRVLDFGGRLSGATALCVSAALRETSSFKTALLAP